MLPSFLGIGRIEPVQHGHIEIWLTIRMFSFHGQRNCIFSIRDERFDMGIGYYEEQFDGWSGEDAIGEITPRYLHFEPAAQRIAEYMPDVKLICFLRNPVERAYSQYWRSEAHSESETLIPFETKLDTMPDIIGTGFYDEHLARYRGFFPETQMCVCLFDDIQMRPKELLSELYTFIGVDPTYVPSYVEHKINASAAQGKLARSNAIWRVRKVLKRMGGAVAMLEKRLENVNSSELPSMDPVTEVRLKHIYHDHTLRLQDMIGRDLSAWL